MLKEVLKFFLLPLVCFSAMYLASCKKDATTDVAATADDATDYALYSAQERGGFGPYGCYELVFPVTIVLPDSTPVVVSSYDEMKDAVRAYFEANGGSVGGGGHHGHQGNRPKIDFLYPISVLNSDGELLTVANQDELEALREACPGTFGNHGYQGHGHHKMECFTLVFPITILFPDSTTQTVNSKLELRTVTHDWRINNPGVPGRPQFVFPITVQLTDDSSLVVLNNKDELHQLKEDCE